MELRLPDLSEGADGAVITQWRAGESERVEKDQDLVEVVTDKAAFDVSAPCSGILVKIVKTEGENVAPGEIIAELQEDRS